MLLLLERIQHQAKVNQLRSLTSQAPKVIVGPVIESASPFGGEGRSAIVHRAYLSGMGEVAVKIFDKSAIFPSAVLDEMKAARRLDELGIGSHYYGPVNANGAYGYAMSIVDGDLPEVMGHAINETTFTALGHVMKIIIDNGHDYYDFHYMVTKDGGVVVIDAGGFIFENKSETRFLDPEKEFNKLIYWQASQVSSVK